jgi:hypothetical protein
VEVGLMAGKKRLVSLPRVDGAQLSQLVGVIAAMVVVVLVNVLAAGRYTRWDWTSNKRYTLSTATVQTLHDLPDTVQVWVLLGGADPLEQSVKQLLVAYQAETTKLDVHFIDPDRDTAALEDVKKRFKIETGRTDNGHVVAEAVVVVARGDRHWFLTSADMVEVIVADDTKVKPREERAVTGAIRSVLAGTKTKVCFTSGHGEMSPADADHGAGLLKDVLTKDNYEITTVDLAAPNAKANPLEGCGVAIVAGMKVPFAPEEAERLRTWVLDDGNLFVAAPPILGQGGQGSGVVTAGLERVLGPFGIALDDDIVTEQEADVAIPNTGGSRFVAQPRKHDIMGGLLKTERVREVPRVVLDISRSMRRISEPGAANAQELLATSPRAFGLRSIAGAVDWQDAPPQKHPGDVEGPLTVALAAERPRAGGGGAAGGGAPHGARIVVVGSASVLSGPSFRETSIYRGSAFFAESAISWLASKPQVLDVPEKAAVGAGMRVNEESRSTIQRYVVLFMPATVALLGVAIALFRRAGEGRAPTKKKAKAKKL